MAESDDEYETRRLREAVPRGLQSDYGAPPHELTLPQRDHLLGSTGEGRDKNVELPKPPIDPVIPGQAASSSANGGNKKVIIDDNGTLNYYNIVATFVAAV